MPLIDVHTARAAVPAGHGYGSQRVRVRVTDPCKSISLSLITPPRLPISYAPFSRIQTIQNEDAPLPLHSTARIHDTSHATTLQPYGSTRSGYRPASHVNRNAFGRLCPRHTPGRHRIFSHLTTPSKQRKCRGSSNNVSGASPALSYAYCRAGRAFFRLSHLYATNQVNSPRKPQHVKEHPGRVLAGCLPMIFGPWRTT